MIDLEAYLIPKISNRCKKMRESHGFTMEKISDKSSVSRIEKGKNTKSGNFITETVLFDYTNTFDKTPEEIIFGNSNELEEILEWIFDRLFALSTRKNFTTDARLYRGITDTDIEAQKAVLAVAESFAEFNIKRYNFLKSNETFMDHVSKKFDKQLFLDGKPINIERDYRNKPINEDTVIDLFDMSDKIWLLCRDKFIRSYKAEVLDSLFEKGKFIYSNINETVSQWVGNQFNKVIIPDIVAKLKSNGIFKIGFMVKNLIDEFLDEDLSVSFQTTVPIQTKRDKSLQLTINNFCLNELSLDERAERDTLIPKILEMVTKGEFLDEAEFPVNKLLRYGISFREVPEVNSTKEVEIDDILNRAITTRKLGRTLNNKPILIEQSPIVKTSDFNSKEEYMTYFDDYYDSIYFQNQNIPGYFTNNSQIIQRWQERLNEDVRESIESFIDIQNNLLKLLTDEELIRFAK
ncbi:helix-turn-helix domain-containing protein [Bacillus cereus]|uniref:helix-turn-helix domain-containing protein n=1 Tax=Bacillus cereus TaxID=1396 RepID=UPI0024BC8D3D|nr:helix-turn-helix transcriptional regulator [Bacillus cereus]WLG16656.1 helix-turn-helix transcriptional regulator [Bacillus cereus]